MINNFCFHYCFYCATNGYITAVAGHQYIRKFYAVSGFTFEAVYKKFIVLLNPELLSCYCYNCKHAPKILRKIKVIFLYTQIKFNLFYSG